MLLKQISKVVALCTKRMSTSSNYQFEFLKVASPSEFVLHVELNNPKKKNAMNSKLWNELQQCFEALATDPDCRSVVLSGVGDSFTSGIDMADFGQHLSSLQTEDVARRAFVLHRIIEKMQDSFSSLERCLKPVIAAVHGPCVGAGVDLICCADIRLGSEDAWFQVKEAAIGLAADVGTLQRLPRLVGSDSLARELVFTARRFSAQEALRAGFLSSVVSGGVEASGTPTGRSGEDSRQAVVTRALAIASEIAALSPVAIQSSKAALIYARDHSVQDGLRMQADCNQVMLQSEDLVKAVMAAMTKEKVQFAKL